MVDSTVRVGSWGTASIALTVLTVLGFVIGLNPRTHVFDLTLAFAPPQPILSVVQRMLDDASWAGSGAGSYESLVPIYRSVDDGVSDLSAPTTASAIMVEVGLPMLWFTAIIAIVAIVVLLRGALLRGRDWVYATAAGSYIITMSLLAFTSVGSLSTITSVILATVVGLGFAQSKSRTAP